MTTYFQWYTSNQHVRGYEKLVAKNGQVFYGYVKEPDYETIERYDLRFSHEEMLQDITSHTEKGVLV